MVDLPEPSQVDFTKVALNSDSDAFCEYNGDVCVGSRSDLQCFYPVYFILYIVSIDSNNYTNKLSVL